MFIGMKEKLKEVGIAPVFFIGSGISRRYISSPNWLGLLEETVKGKDVNFQKLKQKFTDNNGGVNNEQLAQELEDVYFGLLKDDEIIVGGSKSYYFKKRIADILNKYLNEKWDELEINEEIIELKKTRPAAIITTNYDKLLEHIYGEDYSVVVGQNSLLEQVVDGIGEIYKIHGCVDNAKSIVITQSDYENFFQKNHYLNSKLLTLFLEYPIIFMGYSISDRNIISILSTIFEMLSPSKIEELKSRMWFIDKSKDGKNESKISRINLNNGNYIDIQAFYLDNFTELYSSINDINNRRLPMKFLKYLKSNTYELVASQKYNPTLLDVNIEELEKIVDFNDVQQFVGLTFLTNIEVAFMKYDYFCNIYLDDEKNYIYRAKEIIKYREGVKFPFYKFVRQYTLTELLGFTKKNGKLYNQLVDDTVEYSVNIGKKLEVDFQEELNVNNVEKYAELYVTEHKLQLSQKSTVIRYVLLGKLKEDINNIMANTEIVREYQKDIIKVMTHLDDDYIINNKNSIYSMLDIFEDKHKQIYNYRLLLCIIDRSLYRKEIISNNMI